MNTKLVVGLVLGVVVVLYLVVSAAPATPPLQYDATAKERSAPASGASSGDADPHAVKALRSELDQIRALIKSNAAAAAAADGGVALGGVPKAAPKCAVCPPCHECIERKCPPCAAPAPAAPAAGAAAPVSGGSSNAAARCKKFPIDLPAHIKRLTLQVGPHLSPLNSQGDDHAVISFEPQLKVAHANTEKRMKNTYQVPAAVSTYDGLAMFDMADDHQQSASLNTFNPKIASWSGQKVFVPVMRLETVLECLSTERFPWIEYFLCDAQGSDLDVMKSAGAHLKRFRRVEMEVQVNHFAYYQSDNSKANAVAYMQSMGFRVESSHCNGVDAATLAAKPDICEEENVVFVPA